MWHSFCGQHVLQEVLMLLAAHLLAAALKSVSLQSQARLYQKHLITMAAELAALPRHGPPIAVALLLQ